ncbi:MAG TPA: single-stranded DNA-binding protein [Bacteroidales bacterium]|nr:single-stranded DNA-binding protein [Bacteroidales bacterium]HCY24187.1 single-stranded DNA-binding protein [Bacteroidales bacterium]
MNKVELIGRVGKDPDVRETKTGKKMLFFSLATNESYMNAMGDTVQNTIWHRIVLWSEVVLTCEDIVKKGHCLYIAGKLNNRNWVDKDGQKRIITEIVGQVVEQRVPGQDMGVLG